jgi:hypothetical protein
MDPISMGFAVGGSVLGGIAKHKAGKRNKRALYAQAREEEVAGSLQELRIRENARKAIGDQLAAQSSNGFQGGTGSALDYLAESQINMVLDTLTVRREAALKARSLREEGRNRASEGKWGLIEGLIGAGSQAAGMASDWAAVQKAGG